MKTLKISVQRVELKPVPQYVPNALQIKKVNFHKIDMNL